MLAADEGGMKAKAVLSLLRGYGLPVGSVLMLHYYADRLGINVARGSDGNKSRMYSNEDVARISIYLMGKMLQDAAGSKNVFVDNAKVVAPRLRAVVMKELRQGGK